MSDRLTFCPFPKHQGKTWVKVIEVDRRYVEWLVSGEGPKIDDDLYDELLELLEESDGG